MARVKPTPNVVSIKDTGAVNAALAEMAQINREMSAIDLKMNESIDQLKGEAEVQKSRFEHRLAGLEAGLMAYGEFNKDLFEEKRTHQYTYGTLGYRKSTEVKPKGKGTWKEVLGQLQKFKFIDAIRIKEEVDKEELLKWPTERLEVIGVVRHTKDTFFYELDQETTGGTA